MNSTPNFNEYSVGTECFRFSMNLPNLTTHHIVLYKKINEYNAPNFTEYSVGFSDF